MNFIAQGTPLHASIGNAALIREHGSPVEPEPRILFVALVNNVGCERIIAELSRCGSLCALLSPPNYYCTQVALSRHFPLPEIPSVWITALFVRRRLEAATRAWRPHLVLPLDDISAWLLRSLAVDPSTARHVRDLLVRSFGSPRGYPAATHRGKLMELAARLGLRKPMHWQLDRSAGAIANASNRDFPLFIKMDHTCGGDGVTAVTDAAELRRALASRRGGALSRRVKTTMRTALRSLAGFRNEADEGMLVQSFAAGVPAFRTVVAWNGRVLAGVSFVAERIHPEPTGASTVIRHVENKEMEEAAAAMTAALECSGFVSYDFMLDEVSDQATLIEMNPRCVGSCHLGHLFGHDLCGSLTAELMGLNGLPRAEVARPRLVALFPKELERDPDSPYLSSPNVFHDIPVNQPELATSYANSLMKRHPARAGAIRDIIEQALGQRLPDVSGGASMDEKIEPGKPEP